MVTWEGCTLRICWNLIERSHGKMKMYIDTFQNSAARWGVRSEAGETEAREGRWVTEMSGCVNGKMA